MLNLDRRLFLATAMSVAAVPVLAAPARRPRPIDVIEAPTNLGLRPDDKDRIPGTDRAAAMLIEAGLLRLLRVRSRTQLTQLPYSREPEPGTKLRNGSKIRAFNLKLADAVERSRRRGGFPLVVGGECSDMLGGLLGLRRTGGRGLVHIDGHSDFLYPAMDIRQSSIHQSSEKPETLIAFSDILKLDQPGKKTPLYLARGGADQIATLKDSIDRFVTKAMQTDYPLTVANAPGSPHGFDNQVDSIRTREIVLGTLEFLRGRLGLDPAARTPAGEPEN